MVLHIKQCKHCPRNEQCDYRDSLKKEVRGVLPKHHVSFNCKEMTKLFSAGDRVSLHLYDYSLEPSQRYDPYEQREYEVNWVMQAEPVTGKVLQYSHGGFFVIELDKIAIVQGKDGPEEKEFTKKRPNALKLLTE